MRVRRSPFRSTSSISTSHTKGLPALWALRLLLRAQLWKPLAADRYSIDEDVLRLVNLEQFIDSKPTNSELCASLRAQLSALECKDLRSTGLLASNLRELARALTLSELDCEVLCLIALYEGQKGLREVFDLASTFPGQNQMIRLMAVALHQPPALIRRCIAPDSPLRQSGLLKPAEDASDALELAEGLGDILLYRKNASHELLQRYSLVGQLPELPLEAFGHLDEQVKQIQRLVERAGQRGSRGINILVYGEPGTGKTEMVRAIAQAAALQLHEIRYSDSNDMPVYGDQRFAAYRFCQRMLAPMRNTLILFDEIEDVFAHGAGRGRKAWVNRVLEENPRPAFWLSNDIECMDPAFVRRFSIVLRMPKLTDAIRQQIARRQLLGLNVSDAWLTRIAARPGLQPGHLSNAGKVVRHLGLRRPDRVEAALESVLDGLAEALGHSVTALVAERAISSCFDAELVNADQDLETLLSGLDRSRMGRLCLYGPPGTGKSELARYIAVRLGVPLISRKASDLLDCYLGNTEKKLASAFAEATEKGGVLLIDEADSFLYSREGASRSWEVSQVNELLVQMEQYQGVLAMATNHMRVVDSAALRRFDFKIRFEYLKSEQASRFCQKVLEGVGEMVDVTLVRRRLAGIELAPGDFATVKRRLGVLGEELTADSLLKGLYAEWQQRQEGAGRRIGFI
ncbi:MAG: ATP-binding protein [Pseudomonas sp.]|uniref:AAA family ATPase n=1 Tax=Halopseudomonas sp. TaxID=2901191 RepID=UPI001A36532F|nr:ATP-binding protein [Pseudomonas sp.]|tara:strand:- start:5665 stop:7722 length:2058 start_codon:yes stop_codon:yes gene_type:complete